mmetsp:Transcript_6719/g.14047  ORF Transcript_6719/g.14047 Transcript_6719/m.14047 type:complete len:117 (-) Transcript_6719:79-429(-)
MLFLLDVFVLWLVQCFMAMGQAVALLGRGATGRGQRIVQTLTDEKHSQGLSLICSEGSETTPGMRSAQALGTKDSRNVFFFLNQVYSIVDHPPECVTGWGFWARGKKAPTKKTRDA